MHAGHRKIADPLRAGTHACLDAKSSLQLEKRARQKMTQESVISLRHFHVHVFKNLMIYEHKPQCPVRYSLAPLLGGSEKLDRYLDEYGPLYCAA